MSNRTQIPSKVADKLMVMNRRICCICNEKGKHVQIHHIDGDPNNHDIENLAVLCLDCHSHVTGNEGFGRSYTSGEVLSFKIKWEETCDNWFKNKSGLEEEPQGDYVATTIKPNEHTENTYDLYKNDKISVWCTSSDPIGMFIMTEHIYDNWLHSNGRNGFDYIEGAESESEYDIEFEVPDDGFYTVLFLNESNKYVDIEFDIQILEFHK